MTDLGFDGTKDLRPTVKKKAFGKFNPREGDSVDTSALDMAEIARMLEEARKTASG
ncbi:hypothetical protein KBD75_04445 [Candidatus Woesebacteria bacterium]|nr:hypothetical protein [Candidatus Woesebacteria bacterium]